MWGSYSILGAGFPVKLPIDVRSEIPPLEGLPGFDLRKLWTDEIFHLNGLFTPPYYARLLQAVSWALRNKLFPLDTISTAFSILEIGN
jgi:hypothetical protein